MEPGYSPREHSLLLDDREDLLSAAEAAGLPAELWHRRLGHLSLQGSRDDDDFCTGPENNNYTSSSAAEESADERSPKPLTSGEASAGGEASNGEIGSTDRNVRSTRNVPPKRYNDYECYMSMHDGLFVEPQSYDEALDSPQREYWEAAMQSEYDSLVTNNVWELVDRPFNKNIVNASVKCKGI